MPDRTTVGRWWRRYLNILEQTFVNTADMLQLIEPTSIVVVDSTPLVDLYEKDRKIESSWFLKARRIRFSEMRRLL